MIRRIGSAVFFVLFVSFTLLMAACADSSNSNTHSNTNSANSNASSNALSSSDRDFMMKVAIGGMEEVQLGRLATQKGVNNDVKQFGQRMVDDHSRANSELMALAGQKGVTLPSALDQKHQDDVDRLTKLSGAAFDREYMAMMVQDHVEDVAEFQREAASGSDADVRAWAGRTVPTLQQHSQMAQETAAKVGAGAAGGAVGGVGGGGLGNANTAIKASANANAGNHNAGGTRNGNANRRP